MALPAAFLEELRARTPLAALIGRRVKLARSGRQWKGCCPFHAEKTPSFYVYEDGYHCFGCGAHGDAIGFVMQSEGADFLDAVGRLAGEAGLEVPKPTPQAAAAEQRRGDLQAVLDAAARHFRDALRSGRGQPALDYLRRRGLTEATIDAFGLGWAGDGLRLAEALGAAPTLLAEAGLMTEGGDGRMRDFFYRRVTIPIRDKRGRTIGFGGRVLDDAQPKYLNGPETALFSKRRTLFGLDQTHEALRRGQRIVVVEGYLDVIALHQAGMLGAVAPLGTALTEEQLGILWQLTPTPVLCFDGDAAGARAAVRTVTVALPMLTPDNSLGVARLPDGHDPDSFVRARGAGDLASLLETPALSETLFEMLRQGAKPDAKPGTGTPEQHAAFRMRLEAAAKAVRHPALAAEYRRALLDRFFAERRRGGVARRPGASSGRPVPSREHADAARARILAGLLLRHPALLHSEEETIGHLDWSPDLRVLVHDMLDWSHGAQTLDAAELMTHLRTLGRAEQAQALLAGLSPTESTGVRPDATPGEVLQAFWHFVGLLRRALLDDQIARARDELRDDFDAVRARRLTGLCEAKSRLYAAEFAAT